MAKRNQKAHKVVPKYYDSEPYTPKKTITSQPLVQNLNLAGYAAKSVPSRPDLNSGFSVAKHAPGSRPKTPSPLRLSGNPSAHHIGKK